jgi:hypothetical protein
MQALQSSLGQANGQGYDESPEEGGVDHGGPGRALRDDGRMTQRGQPQESDDTKQCPGSSKGQFSPCGQNGGNGQDDESQHHRDEEEIRPAQQLAKRRRQ